MFNFIPLLAVLPAVLAAPAATTTSKASSAAPSSTATWWKPTLSNTFLYDADNVPVPAPIVTTNTKLQLNKDVYIVDMEGHTAAQIAAYKKAGKRVACYLSAGSWEKPRADASKFNTDCYCGQGVKLNSTGWCSTTTHQMDGWNEWWLNIGDATCLSNIKPIMTARMQAAKTKGCDAVDPDNMDAFTNDQYGITAQQQVDYLTWFAQEAHRLGLGIGLKNAGELLGDYNDGKVATKTPYTDVLVKNFDFSVIESCAEYKECFTYKAMLDAGKPQLQVEYYSKTTSCSAVSVPKGVTFSVYSDGVLNTQDINLDCPVR